MVRGIVKGTHCQWYFQLASRDLLRGNRSSDRLETLFPPFSFSPFLLSRPCHPCLVLSLLFGERSPASFFAPCYQSLSAFISVFTRRTYGGADRRTSARNILFAASTLRRVLGRCNHLLPHRLGTSWIRKEFHRNARSTAKDYRGWSCSILKKKKKREKRHERNNFDCVSPLTRNEKSDHEKVVARRNFLAPVDIETFPRTASGRNAYLQPEDSFSVFGKRMA